jgi:glycosyltransferase involved in cell wall biosynthesis
VRVLIDYRPALRERSGVGEYTHQLVRALLNAFPPHRAERPLDLTVFSSSWKDRLDLPPDLAGAAAVDRRIPVSALNFSWHRAGWPSAELLTSRRFDVTHSSHQLLLPTRDAAQVVTAHDLNFLTHPERTRAEIRRDYPALAKKHAHRADRIVVTSPFGAREVERLLDIPPERIAICPPGAPDWPCRSAPPAAGGYILFFGTLEPRKNVGGLLDAYALLLERRRDVPEMVLAGKATEAARPWLERLARPPLAGRVRHIGYVDPEKRYALYEGACLLVQPSFEEGFGLPVLEAMTVGVPVIAATRGSLPELVDGAGLLVNPDDPEEIAAAIEHVVDDATYAAAAAAQGIQRAAQFSWARTAQAAYDTYLQAIEHRRCASA